MGYKLIKSIGLDELLSGIGVSFKPTNAVINSISGLSDAVHGSLLFASKLVDPVKEGVVFCLEGQDAEFPIVVEKPRLAFCRALNFLLDNNYLCRRSIWGDGLVDNSSHIATSAVIEPHVILGKNCVIEHNVVIHSGSILGDNVIIRSGSIIGSQGFGFEKADDGSYIRFPHLGRVFIGDNVEIGALNSICIGGLSDTVIESGVKTDNLVHIAHNCRVGKNAILTACVELSGSVVIGDNVWLGPNSSVLQKVTIGADSVVGIGSVVRKNVDSGCTVAGNPARRIK